MKVVISTCYGGFGLSRKAILRLRELDCQAAKDEVLDGELYKNGKLCEYFHGHMRNIDREDPHLVQVVEEMGREADGYYASLKIVEIPDDIKWSIEEYDGMEWVSENHQTWT